MDLIKRARQDYKTISQGEFSVAATLKTADEQTVLELRCLATSHALSVDPEIGVPINSNNHHVSISEGVLIDNNYPYIDSKNQAELKGHIISFENSAGELVTFKINQTFPDRTLGVLLCILGNFSA